MKIKQLNGRQFIRYPKAYQEEFIRDLFFAANEFNKYLGSEKKRMPSETSDFPVPCAPEGFRTRLELETEQKLNEDAECRIIGVTLVRDL